MFCLSTPCFRLHRRLLFRLFITPCLSLKKNQYPVLSVINSSISFPFCFTCNAMLHGLYSLLCYYLPQIRFAPLHELFLTAEQRRDVNLRRQSAESAVKQEHKCLSYLSYPKRFSENWESSVCGYHHTDEASITGGTWTSRHALSAYQSVEKCYIISALGSEQ